MQIQFQITNICSVRILILYLICEPSTQKHGDEAKQRLNNDLEPQQKKTTITSTKTPLFKYIENFTTKKGKFSGKNIRYFFIYLLKT